MGRESQIIRRTTFLNAVDDEAAGGPVSGVGEAQYQGQLGGELFLTAAQAAKASDTSAATLFAGIYRYIRTKAASTLTPARGIIAFWDVATAGLTDSVVTPDLPTGTSLIAGIYLNAITKTAPGNFGFIQTSGIANVAGVGTYTKTTPAVGDRCFATTGALMDVLADATAITSLNDRTFIGIAEEVPTDGAISRVLLNLPQLP